MKNKTKLLLLASWLCLQSQVCWSVIGWSLPATNLSPADDFSIQPQVAMDCQGNAVAVWTNLDAGVGGKSVIQAKRFIVGSGWQADPTTLSPTDDNSDQPQVAMDCQGNAVAVWTNRDAGESNKGVIQAKRFIVGSGWQAVPETLSPTDNNSDQPQVAMDCQGNAVAVWRNIDAGESIKGVIQAKRFIVGSGWQAVPENLSPADNNSDQPQVAMDCQGNAVTVWRNTDAGESNKDVIQAKRFIVGSGWQADTETLSPIDDDSAQPQVAMDCQGNAVAVWRNDVVGGKSFISVIQAKRFIVGSGWQADTETLSPTDDFSDEPQVAMDCQGNAVAVWINRDAGEGDKHVIQAKRFILGSGWQATPTTLSPIDNNSIQPQVAMDCQGNAVAVWTNIDAGEGGKDVIQAKSFIVGSGWQADPTTLSPTDDNSDQPQVAMDCQGNAVAVWANGDAGVGDKYVIQATNFTFKLPAPSNLIAFQKTYRSPAQAGLVRTLCWDAVTDAVKYRIYIDAEIQFCVKIQPVDFFKCGETCCPEICQKVTYNESNVNERAVHMVLIAEIPAKKKPFFEIRGICPGKKVTYYVFPVDETGDNGVPASITV